MAGEIQELRWHQIGRDPMSGVRHRTGDNCLILQPLEADGSIVIGERLYPLQNGCVYLVNTGCIHGTSPRTPERYVRNKVVILKDYLRDLLTQAGAEDFLRTYFERQDGGCYKLPARADAEIDALMKEMAAAYAVRESYWELAVRGGLLRVLWRIAHSAEEGGQDGAGAVPDALAYIGRNYASPLTLEEIARAAHVSKYHLSRMFRQATGMTVFAYITEHRLARARELLTETELSATAVAGEAGFESASYFCRTFRAGEGMTPLDYRRRSRSVSEI